MCCCNAAAVNAAAVNATAEDAPPEEESPAGGRLPLQPSVGGGTLVETAEDTPDHFRAPARRAPFRSAAPRYSLTDRAAWRATPTPRTTSARANPPALCLAHLRVKMIRLPADITGARRVTCVLDGPDTEGAQKAGQGCTGTAGKRTMTKPILPVHIGSLRTVSKEEAREVEMVRLLWEHLEEDEVEAELAGRGEGDEETYADQEAEMSGEPDEQLQAQLERRWAAESADLAARTWIHHGEEAASDTEEEEESSEDWQSD